MSATIKTILIPAVSAAFGGLAVYGAMKANSIGSYGIIRPAQSQKSPARILDGFDTLFNDDFFEASELSQREDEKFIYYDVHVADLNSTSINTKVENGYITISGTTEKTSYFKSSFNRTFPVPDHVDSNKMEMSSEGDKVVLRFPKLVS